MQLLAENALEGGIYNAEALQRMLLNSKHFERCESSHMMRYMTGDAQGQLHASAHCIIINHHSRPPVARGHGAFTKSRWPSVQRSLLCGSCVRC